MHDVGAWVFYQAKQKHSMFFASFGNARAVHEFLVLVQGHSFVCCLLHTSSTPLSLTRCSAFLQTASLPQPKRAPVLMPLHYLHRKRTRGLW